MGFDMVYRKTKREKKNFEQYGNVGGCYILNAMSFQDITDQGSSLIAFFIKCESL